MSTKKPLITLVFVFLILRIQQLTISAQPVFPIDWDKSACLIETYKLDSVRNKGTGFFITDTSDSILKKLLFLVTNKHVVQGADSIRISYFDLISGTFRLKTVPFTNPEQKSHMKEHIDSSIDIAVIALPPGIKVSAYLVPPFVDLGKVTFGDDAYFFGYPFGYRLPRPIVRKGTISYLSHEPLPIKIRKVNYVIKGGVFLIDGFAWEGNSGSPVVCPTHSFEAVHYGQRERFSLSGIIFGYLPAIDSPNSGLAIALPYKRVAEVIDLFK